MVSLVTGEKKIIGPPELLRLSEKHCGPKGRWFERIPNE
jgi:hypothetical protein